MSGECRDSFADVDRGAEENRRRKSGENLRLEIPRGLSFLQVSSSSNSRFAIRILVVRDVVVCACSSRLLRQERTGPSDIRIITQGYGGAEDLSTKSAVNQVVHAQDTALPRRERDLF
jgi:hypothetical protein